MDQIDAEPGAPRSHEPTDQDSHRGLAALRRRNLSEDVVDGLLDFIAGGSAPERRLPVERALCEQLHVSRSTVREALSTLAQLGVVVTRGKGRYGSLVGARAELARRERGRRVRTELIDHPLEARRILEPPVAALAAERGSPHELADVARELDLMEQAAIDGREIVSYDSAFHSAIARATGNPTLVFLIDALTAALTDSREHSRRIDGGRARTRPVQDRAAACASPRRLVGRARQARAPLPTAAGLMTGARAGVTAAGPPRARRLRSRRPRRAADRR